MNKNAAQNLKRIACPQDVFGADSELREWPSRLKWALTSTKGRALLVVPAIFNIIYGYSLDITALVLLITLPYLLLVYYSITKLAPLVDGRTHWTIASIENNSLDFPHLLRRSNSLPVRLDEVARIRIETELEGAFPIRVTLKSGDRRVFKVLPQDIESVIVFLCENLTWLEILKMRIGNADDIVLCGSSKSSA